MQTTIAFGVWFGMIFIGPFVGIIKHVRIQFIVLMSICVAFLGKIPASFWAVREF
jgi:hypothetical protein